MQLVVFFGMTIRKFVSTAKNRRGRLHPRHGKNEKFSPLFMALVRDGTVFFLLYVFTPYNDLDCSTLQRIAGSTTP